MKTDAQRFWTALPALFLLWLAIGVVAFKFFEKSEATRLIYSLDDAYIHMAMAKNLADAGVYGVTKHEFSSSSSSPLWVILLYLCTKAFSVREMAPFILNVGLASAALGAAWSILRRHVASPALVSFGVLACLGSSFVLPLVFTGMEHIAHMLLVTIFCYSASRRLSSKHREGLALTATAFLLPVTRYESLFLVALVVALLLARKMYRAALLVGLFSSLGVGLYAAVSIAAGSMAFPNPVLVKGALPNLLDPAQSIAFMTSGLRSLHASPHMLGLVVVLLLTLFLVSSRDKIWSISSCMLILCLSSIFFHAQFARLSDPLHRYEAYLIFLGAVSIGVALGDMGLDRSTLLAMARAQTPRALAAGILIVLMAFPLFSRNLYWFRLTHVGMRNIYEQQYQMGLFLREHYSNQGVAVNDIGAVNYLADVRILDLVGLANAEVARLWMDRNYTTDSMEALASARQIHIAIVYDHWFSASAYLPPLPPGWLKAGEWTIANNVVCGGPTVSFYAIKSEEFDSLSRNLRDYSKKLPASVRESGPYTENL